MPALNPNSRNVTNCAKKGWSIVISNFCDPDIVKNHVENYLKHSSFTKTGIKKNKISKIYICG